MKRLYVYVWEFVCFLINYLVIPLLRLLKSAIFILVKLLLWLLKGVIYVFHNMCSTLLNLCIYLCENLTIHLVLLSLFVVAFCFLPIGDINSEKGRFFSQIENLKSLLTTHENYVYGEKNVQKSIYSRIDVYIKLVSFFVGFLSLLIVIYQVKMHRRSREIRMFTQTFTTLITQQQNIISKECLRNKVFRENCGFTNDTKNRLNAFSGFVAFFDQHLEYQNLSELFKTYKRTLNDPSSFDCCFKYMYHMFEIILSTESISSEKQQERFCTELVQAGLNHDVLFCYIVNLLAHNQNFPESINDLRKVSMPYLHKFFNFCYDLCRKKKKVDGNVCLNEDKKTIERSEYTLLATYKLFDTLRMNDLFCKRLWNIVNKTYEVHYLIRKCNVSTNLQYKSLNVEFLRRHLYMEYSQNGNLTMFGNGVKLLVKNDMGVSEVSVNKIEIRLAKNQNITIKDCDIIDDNNLIHINEKDLVIHGLSKTKSHLHIKKKGNVIIFSSIQSCYLYKRQNGLNYRNNFRLLTGLGLIKNRTGNQDYSIGDYEI